MPGLVRKLLIFAAVDGLILQPAPPKNHPPATQQAIKIDWKGNVAPLLKDRRAEETSATLEAWGVIGLLKVASTNFLISISSREQVANVRGKPVYTISDVALIPLASQAEAEKAITLARDAMTKQAKVAETAGSGDESDDDGAGTVSEIESLGDDEPNPPTSFRKDPVTGRQHERTSSISQDVIQNKGLYGRFAQRWFSQKGWSAEGRKMQGISSEEDLSRKRKQEAEQSSPEDTSTSSKDTEGVAQALQRDQKMDEGIQQNEDAPPQIKPNEIPKALGETHDDTSVVLLPKILRTAKLYFGSKSFFFSYDLDLSKRLALHDSMSNSSGPLFKQFDPLFFWNHHLIRPLIDAGQHSFVLPIIQGFVGQRAFTVDLTPDSSKNSVVDAASSLKAVLNKHTDPVLQEVDTKEGPTKGFLLTLISRRSIKRAGLRYLRRGIDGEGNVANNVETEQILSSPTWDTTNDRIYSFTQYRGSIPLFFHQSPYSLKPVVEFDGTPAMNNAAFKAHFAGLTSRYGGVQVASLIDKHGNEAKVGEAFENHAKSLNEDGGVDGNGRQIGFEWFDFHNACRGMKFENVSILMDTIGPFLTSHGWTVQEGDKLSETQSGILRTNCMDCLDRTNVTQSATARIVLEAQLKAQNISIDLQTDPRTSWFNTLWADNGDAISRQYSGTAALKGDYTRTRRRQISGALTDFGLTLTRYYNNIVNDYFAQALIDYLLGRATETIFADFEADMKAQDYAIDLRKVRQGAIDRCVEIAIEDHSEDLVAGWTLSCPSEPNTLRALPFEECVLLLTEKALYSCRLDWATEKVKMFERIDLSDIDSVSRGTYITSTLASRYMDEQKNFGFVIEYRAHKHGIVRHNTRSLDSASSSQPRQEQADQAARRDSEDEHTDPDTPVDPRVSETPGKTSRLLAFKALPPKSSFAKTEGNETEAMTETQTIALITDEIVRIADQLRKAGDGGVVTQALEKGLKVEEKDVIGLAEAKRATGWVEQLGYNLKRLVWT